MAHKPYTHRWCAVKGDASWTFTTRDAAQAKADDVSLGEQVDIYELVRGTWVWRSSGLCIVCKPDEVC